MRHQLKFVKSPQMNVRILHAAEGNGNTGGVIVSALNKSYWPARCFEAPKITSGYILDSLFVRERDPYVGLRSHLNSEHDDLRDPLRAFELRAQRK